MHQNLKVTYDFLFIENQKALTKICTKSREKLKDVKKQYAELEKKIPKGQYYR